EEDLDADQAGGDRVQAPELGKLRLPRLAQRVDARGNERGRHERAQPGQEDGDRRQARRCDPHPRERDRAEGRKRAERQGDPVEAEMRRYADERDGFPIVGPVVGGLLYQLALILRARRIFEVGSGFGYSAFWFARALPDGGAVTLTEYDPDHLERAHAWLGS